MAVCIFASSASSAGYGVAHELAFGSRGYIIHNGTVIRERPYQKNRGWKSSLSSIATAPNSLSQLAPHRPLIIANNFCDLIGHITFKSSTDFFKTSKSARKLAIKPFLQKMLNGFESWSHTLKYGKKTACSNTFVKYQFVVSFPVNLISCAVFFKPKSDDLCPATCLCAGCHNIDHPAGGPPPLGWQTSSSS